MPTTITEWREQNPAYKDRSDDEIAGALYKKYYTGRVDEAEFRSMFLPQAERPSLASRLTPDFIERPARAVAGAIGDAVRGDAEFPDMSSVNSLPGRGGWATAVASLAGNDEDYRNAYAKAYPEDEIREDKNGNFYAITPEGKRGAINKAGLDLEDVTRFVGKTLPFLATGGAAGIATKGAGQLAKVAAQGAAAAGTDAAMQVASGRDEIDRGQVALTGALGGAGEAMAPAVGSAARAIAQRFGVDKWSRMSPDLKQRAIANQLFKDGFEAEDFRGMTRKDAMKFGEDRVKQGAASSPDATLASSEFGYQPTAGLAMPTGTSAERSARREQLSREAYLRTKQGPGDALHDLDEANAATTADVIERISDEMTGRQSAGSRNSAAQRVGDGLREAEERSREEYGAAYGRAAEYDGEFADEVALGIPDRVRKALDDGGVIIDPKGNRSLTPGALSVLDELESNPQTTIRGMENARKKINNAMADVGDNAADRRALGILKSEYDDAIADAVDSGLFNGDPKALDELKSARSLYAQHARRFNNKDEAGKIVTKMLEDDRPASEIAGYFTTASGFNKRGAARLVERYAEAVGGKNTTEFLAVRETYFRSVMTRSNAEAKGADGVVGSLKRALYGDGEETTKALFTGQQIAKLKRLVRSVEATQIPATHRNSSNSAPMAARIINGSRIGNMPGIRTILEQIADITTAGEASKATKLPVLAADPVNLTPAAGAAVAGDDD